MFKEIEQVKKEIQEHEGFRDTIYSDSLGFATIGWGHLVKDTDHFEEGVASVSYTHLTLPTIYSV